MNNSNFTRKTLRLFSTLFALTMMFSASTTLNAQCDPDVTSPIITCINTLNVSLPWNPASTELWGEDFTETAWDFCDDNLTYEIGIDGSPTLPSIVVGCPEIGTHTIEVKVTDDAGNSNNCFATLQLEDKLAPAMICDAEPVITLETVGSTILLPEDILEGTIVDNCSAISFEIGPIDGPLTSQLTLDCTDVGTWAVMVTGTDDSGNNNACWAMLTVLGNPTACSEVVISGNVFQDSNSDCLFDAGEEGIAGWSVEVTYPASGNSEIIETDINGYYETTAWFDPFNPTNTLEISLPGVPGFVLPCGTIFTLDIPAGQTTGVADIPVVLSSGCALLQADIATPVVRACMESTYYISFCSYTDAIVNGAYMEVTLDPNVTATSSSIPWSGVSGNTYTFDLGSIDVGSCDGFTIDVDVNCDVILGQTLCAEVVIYPAEICAPVDPGYTGASLWVESECIGNEVKFTVKNIGTGAMSESQNYVIVEDVIMYMSNPIDLGPGEEMEIFVPANGSTWRFESPNESLYPGEFKPTAWFEGCGGINNTGIVNMFPVNINEPYRAVFCLEVTGSYDPNDKRGWPMGLESAHFIQPNVDLEYMIRFQNTGTDTAFTVVIEDEIDPQFQLGTLRPGASSHDYEFESLGDGTIRFIFNNILLPDSIVNEPGSHGFVKFKISQQPDLAPGSIINNEAAIYFDFNDPIITNETWHQIVDEVFSDLKLVSVSSEGMTLSPNPVQDMLTVEVDNSWNGDINLYILNINGQIVKQVNQFKQGGAWQAGISVNALSDGTYYLILTDGNQMMTKPFVRQ